MKKTEAKSKEKIVEAATALLREAGDAGALSVRDISARCGAGIGLLNYHFQTKENLMGLCAARALDPLFAELEGLAAQAEEDPMACLRLMAKRYMSGLAGDPGIARASLLMAARAPGPDDHRARATGAFLPCVRAACSGRATDREMKMLCALLLDGLHAAFLRGEAYAAETGFNLTVQAQREQLADFMIYILFHKYL